jgi:hypothetical protein
MGSFKSVNFKLIFKFIQKFLIFKIRISLKYRKFTLTFI